MMRQRCLSKGALIIRGRSDEQEEVGGAYKGQGGCMLQGDAAQTIVGETNDSSINLINLYKGKLELLNNACVIRVNE